MLAASGWWLVVRVTRASRPATTRARKGAESVGGLGRHQEKGRKRAPAMALVAAVVEAGAGAGGRPI